MEVIFIRYEVYDGRSALNSQELYHSKYLRKYMGKNGKMIYVYKNTAGNYRKDGFEDHYTNFNNQKGETLLTTSKGRNTKNNFVGVSIGKGAKSRKDYKYRSGSIKLGKTKITIDNDEGRLNIYAYTQKKQKQINKGSKAVKKYLR